MNWTDIISNQKTETKIVSDCGFRSHLKSPPSRGRCGGGLLPCNEGLKDGLKGTKAWSTYKNTMAGERVKVEAREDNKTRKERLGTKGEQKQHRGKQRIEGSERGREGEGEERVATVTRTGSVLGATPPRIRIPLFVFNQGQGNTYLRCIFPSFSLVTVTIVN